MQGNKELAAFLRKSAEIKIEKAQAQLAQAEQLDPTPIPTEIAEAAEEAQDEPLSEDES